MRIGRSFTVILAFLTLFTSAVLAQKTPARRPVTRATPVRSTLPPLEVRAARVKVSNQLSNVEQFVKVLGPVAQSIEALDADIRSKKVSKKSIEQNQANKKKVMTAISTLRGALVSLETEFRTKQDLKKYLIKIQGISELANQSESLAVSGKFVASRDPLKAVAQKLNDTLKAMPAAEL